MANSLTTLRRSIARMLDPPAPATPLPAPSAPLVIAPETALDWRYRTDLGSIRAQLAQRYIHGAGIEFGALDFPLALPQDAKVTYADFEGAAVLP